MEILVTEPGNHALRRDRRESCRSLILTVLMSRYSWMTGIDEVAQVVFVRKRLVEVQYLRAVISDEQRQEFATLVEDTVRRIESGLFLPHSGIRFPQNPCTTCPFIGLCLDKREMVEAALLRKPGVDLGLFDELLY
jgi:hypothetical protein